jgi:hypothetical protein
MRRRQTFPKANDRISLAIPLPNGSTSRERTGTVLERSCGRSGALRVRWDADGDRAATEGWLADAEWHWSHNHLRVVTSSTPPRTPGGMAGADTAGAETGPGGGELWLSGRAGAPPLTAGTAAAADEWEAALAADAAPGDDDSWQDVLATALGLREAPPAPSPDAAQPAPVRLAPAPPAPSPAPLPPVPELVRTPDAPRGGAAPWTGDDILPNRGARRGRRRG